MFCNIYHTELTTTTDQIQKQGVKILFDGQEVGFVLVEFIEMIPDMPCEEHDNAEDFHKSLTWIDSDYIVNELIEKGDPKITLKEPRANRKTSMNWDASISVCILKFDKDAVNRDVKMHFLMIMVCVKNSVTNALLIRDMYVLEPSTHRAFMVAWYNM
jgi:hypothetical protein